MFDESESNEIKLKQIRLDQLFFLLLEKDFKGFL